MNGPLYTIGFTKTTAEHFFERLRAAGVTTLLDTRLKATGQLAGFAKAADLAYFLPRLAGGVYASAPDLAPTTELLHAYRFKALSWRQYAARYRALIEQRNALDDVPLGQLVNACLLCSEHTPDRCHRSVAAEYLSLRRGGFTIIHL